MMDIGIQTGVLARVQHIYGGKGKSGPGQKQEVCFLITTFINCLTKKLFLASNARTWSS